MRTERVDTLEKALQYYEKALFIQLQNLGDERLRIDKTLTKVRALADQLGLVEMRALAG